MQRSFWINAMPSEQRQNMMALVQVSSDGKVPVSLFMATDSFGNPMKAMYSPRKEADVLLPTKCYMQFQGVYGPH